MDFSKYDQRGKAEQGQAFPLCDPETGEPIGEARVIIRGPAARAVQEASHRWAVERMTAPEGDDPTGGKMTIHSAHEEAVRLAAPWVAGFENVELDGKPATIEDARRILDMTLPRLERDDATGEYRVANKTFAMQVLEHASTIKAALGNG